METGNGLPSPASLFASEYIRRRNFGGKKSGLKVEYDPDSQLYKVCYYRPGDRERLAATGDTLEKALGGFLEKLRKL